MSNFRILILAFLVVVLAVLGMIYVNIFFKNGCDSATAADGLTPAPVNPSPYLPMPSGLDVTAGRWPWAATYMWGMPTR